jgi:hypothetical protein
MEAAVLPKLWDLSIKSLGIISQLKIIFIFAAARTSNHTTIASASTLRNGPIPSHLNGFFGIIYNTENVHYIWNLEDTVSLFARFIENSSKGIVEL